MRLKLFLLLTIAFAGSAVAQQPGVSIRVPAGFAVANVAKDFGRVRHIAVNSNGDVYMKLEKLNQGKGIYRLRDTNKDGIMDDTLAFGNYIGTGIALKNGYLYASSNSEVFRYKLDAQLNLVNPDQPETIVTGLVDKRQHASKSIALDNAGNIYVNIGAPSNACQEQDRKQGSPGMNPCLILETAGGIWQFKADQPNQTYKEGVRYATGIRNCVGLDWNSEVNELFITVHGRDMLYQFYPETYDQKRGAELPSETLYMIKKGDDCGWPYVHWDHFQNKKILNPEYGGDGKKTGAEKALRPLVGFPGHMAPNALLFYTGNRFPEKYKHGAFIAFHGSWNRAPENQEGFYVVFVPMKDGKPTGKWEVFADGFSGVEKVTSLSAVKHRPCGLAQGPDGSIYVSDDNKGYVWKINYNQ
ncbi:MAG TPA: PQQ-dependent sugar dehydrogenase [Sediminibacterium sp.]|nr:PQQ-dependent sugar dehydrogenase [Sediminibacterium sp.]